MHSGDEAEVLAVFDALFAALTDRRDAAAATALFADEPDAIMWGSEQSVRAHRPRRDRGAAPGIADFAGDISFRWHERHTHVDNGVAWANADGEVAGTADGSAPRATPYRITAVLVRRNHGWRWHTFNGSEPTAA